MKSENPSPGRRQVITIGAAVGAASAIGGFPAIVHAQSDKIRIGHLTPLTGFLGLVGDYAVLSIKMVVEESRFSATWGWIRSPRARVGRARWGKTSPPEPRRPSQQYHHRLHRQTAAGVAPRAVAA